MQGATMRDSLAVSPARVFVAAEMLAPEQAIVAFFARASIAPPGEERVPLDEAAGRILARDLRAPADLPAHARSTMDGFAVRSADGTAPRRIVGEVRMGQAPPRGVGSGEALRIPTGGALPDGADAVVPNEDAAEADGRIAPAVAVQPGDALTPAGSDVRAGDLTLRVGRRIGGPELGLLATLGCVSVPVFRRPRFGVLSTGDELVDPGRDPGVGQVRDSNRYAIAGALRAMGALAEHEPRCGDEPDALRAALTSMVERYDALVVTGGSSVGERDWVPRIVAGLGEPGLIVHGIRLRPGKPTMFAAVGGKPIIGLPGNPTSSLIVLEAVARPIVAACTGERGVRPQTIEAVAEEPFNGREGWTWYVPAQVRSLAGRLLARPLPIHSAWVSLPARAAGYVTVGESPSRVEAGAPVTVNRYSCGGAPVEETVA
jgi:molybdenum cofactor synthesis domain-containing protein